MNHMPLPFPKTKKKGKILERFKIRVLYGSLCFVLSSLGGVLLAGKVNYYSSEVVGRGEESFSGLCFWSWDLWQLPITVG